MNHLPTDAACPAHVAKTITRVLQQAEEPMSVQRIHVACEQLLGRPVVYGTVRDWLSDNAKTDKVTRVKHGIYRLASAL